MLQNPWAGLRNPVENADAERLRSEAYWSRLDVQPPGSCDAPSVWVENGFAWVQLTTPSYADFEARHTRHSIGHSFDKYSAKGDLFSMRALDGTPVATVLVVGRRIVHAREHHNARLSPEAQISLGRFAYGMGFLVVPDQLPLDVRADASLANTELRLCRREGLQAKSVARVVFPSELIASEAKRLAEILAGNRVDLAKAGWIPVVDLDGPDAEIVALVASGEIPSQGAPDFAAIRDRLASDHPAPSIGRRGGMVVYRLPGRRVSD